MLKPCPKTSSASHTRLPKLHHQIEGRRAEDGTYLMPAPVRQTHYFRNRIARGVESTRVFVTLEDLGEAFDDDIADRRGWGKLVVVAITSCSRSARYDL
jgi:hypothetical protein